MTLNEGVFSVWKGHRPLQRRPDLLQCGVLADQVDDVGGRPDLGDLLVRYPHAPTVPRRCRRPDGPTYVLSMAVTIYGVCALTFMMGMYALEGRGRAFILAFALGCALSSSYGFLSGAWPFGVVEAIWTLIALRRYVVAGRPARAAPSARAWATPLGSFGAPLGSRAGLAPGAARTACAAARRATGTRKGEQLT